MIDERGNATSGLHRIDKEARTRSVKVCFLLWNKSWDMITEPAETLSIAHLPNDTNHKELNRANVSHRSRILPSSKMMKAKGRPKLFVASSPGHINLIAKDEEGNIGKHFVVDKGVKFFLNFWEALAVDGVDKEDYTINLCIVVAPDLTSGGMTTEIKGAESDFADNYFFGRWLLGWDVEGDAVVAKYMH